ncbi:OLC1v1024058C1 [Oldenlandia corymbosa var. corymbosa]|uniref:OLC1v1024058C1 n=1 Tax=Oldenlandia corymbosa var. corymbosa TaxID=529605 RepID=A0AAV1C3S7_OLDCO|nr:OLC1v1024058C1 [Oldenlandia corymbosa var. corymbosa]
MDPSLFLSDGESDDESSSSTVRKIFVILRRLEFASQASQWHERHRVKEPSIDYSIAREIYLRRLYYRNDRVCREQLRLNKHCFSVLCTNLKELGMKDSNHVTVEEVVAMFLYVLSFNLTNRKVSFNFIRSGETVSRYFNIVLHAVLKLGRQYVVQPTTEMEGFEDE